MPHATHILRTVLAGTALFSSVSAEAGGGFAAVLDVCEATTLDEATTRGDRLGWQPLLNDSNGRTDKAQDGSAVRVIGWRRSTREGDESLSYAVASGPNAPAGCSFVTEAPGLLEALNERFGAPDTFKEQDGMVSAFWRRDGLAVSFTRFGKGSGISLSRRG